MRWTPRGRSANLEDRRAEGGRNFRRFAPLGASGLLVLIVLSLLTGRNFLSLFDLTSDQTVGPSSESPVVGSSPEEEQLVQFVSFVLDDAQETWERLLAGRYQRTTLVLFRDAIQSACGFAESATGPFYCPGDRKVYVDLGFYTELRQQFGAPGDFAQAYVLAHEIGHHVQTLLGIEGRMRQMQQARPQRANDLSVRLELQADCFAGLWGNSSAERNILERGDVEEGLGAAAAIGDDRIQRMSGARVAPDRFTHGSSAQRIEWFRRGLQSGQLDACDTFN
jgi:hypothetical protein